MNNKFNNAINAKWVAEVLTHMSSNPSQLAQVETQNFETPVSIPVQSSTISENTQKMASQNKKSKIQNVQKGHKASTSVESQKRPENSASFFGQFRSAKINTSQNPFIQGTVEIQVSTQNCIDPPDDDLDETLPSLEAVTKDMEDDKIFAGDSHDYAGSSSLATANSNIEELSVEVENHIKEREFYAKLHKLPKIQLDKEYIRKNWVSNERDLQDLHYLLYDMDPIHNPRPGFQYEPWCSIQHADSTSRSLTQKGNWKEDDSMIPILAAQLEAGIISECLQKDLKCWQPIFAVIKPDKDRGVYNAIGINHFFTPDKFSLPTPIDPIMNYKREWFAKLDISAFFHHVKFSESFSKYFGFSFGGKWYKFNRMPFGLRFAPWLATLVFGPFIRKMIKIFRAEGLDVDLSTFYDDNLVSANTESDANRALDLMLDELTKAGFCINHEKTVRATTQIDWLGFVIKKNNICLSEKKKETIRLLYKNFQTAVKPSNRRNTKPDREGSFSVYTIGDYLSFVGVLSFCALVVPGSRLKVNSAIASIPALVRINRKTHEEPYLPYENEPDNLKEVVGMMLNSGWYRAAVHSKTFEIVTDASTDALDQPAYGFSNGDIHNPTYKTVLSESLIKDGKVGHYVKSRQAQVHEALAIYVAIKGAIQEKLSQINIVVYTDNVAVERAFANDDSGSKAVADIVAKTKSLAANHNIFVCIRRCTTNQCAADLPSRQVMGTKTNWKSLFHLTKKFQVHMQEFADQMLARTHPTITLLSKYLGVIQDEKSSPRLLSSRKVLSYLAKYKYAIVGQHAGALAFSLAFTFYTRHKIAKGLFRNKHVQELVAYLRSIGKLKTRVLKKVVYGSTIPTQDIAAVSEPEEAYDAREQKKLERKKHFSQKNSKDSTQQHNTSDNPKPSNAKQNNNQTDFSSMGNTKQQKNLGASFYVANEFLNAQNAILTDTDRSQIQDTESDNDNEIQSVTGFKTVEDFLLFNGQPDSNQFQEISKTVPVTQSGGPETFLSQVDSFLQATQEYSEKTYLPVHTSGFAESFDQSYNLIPQPVPVASASLPLIKKELQVLINEKEQTPSPKQVRLIRPHKASPFDIRLKSPSSSKKQLRIASPGSSSTSDPDSGNKAPPVRNLAVNSFLVSNIPVTDLRKPIIANPSFETNVHMRSPSASPEEITEAFGNDSPKPEDDFQIVTIAVKPVETPRPISIAEFDENDQERWDIISESANNDDQGPPEPDLDPIAEASHESTSPQNYKQQSENLTMHYRQLPQSPQSPSDIHFYNPVQKVINDFKVFEYQPKPEESFSKLSKWVLQDIVSSEKNQGIILSLTDEKPLTQYIEHVSTPINSFPNSPQKYAHSEQSISQQSVISELTINNQQLQQQISNLEGLQLQQLNIINKKELALQTQLQQLKTKDDKYQQLKKQIEINKMEMSSTTKELEIQIADNRKLKYLLITEQKTTADLRQREIQETSQNQVLQQENFILQQKMDQSQKEFDELKNNAQHDAQNIQQLEFQVQSFQQQLYDLQNSLNRKERESQDQAQSDLQTLQQQQYELQQQRYINEDLNSKLEQMYYQASSRVLQIQQNQMVVNIKKAAFMHKNGKILYRQQWVQEITTQENHYNSEGQSIYSQSTQSRQVSEATSSLNPLSAVELSLGLLSFESVQKSHEQLSLSLQPTNLNSDQQHELLWRKSQAQTLSQLPLQFKSPKEYLLRNELKNFMQSPTYDSILKVVCKVLFHSHIVVGSQGFLIALHLSVATSAQLTVIANILNEKQKRALQTAHNLTQEAEELLPLLMEARPKVEVADYGKENYRQFRVDAESWSMLKEFVVAQITGIQNIPSYEHHLGFEVVEDSLQHAQVINYTGCLLSSQASTFMFNQNPLTPTQQLNIRLLKREEQQNRALFSDPNYLYDKKQKQLQYPLTTQELSELKVYPEREVGISNPYAVETLAADCQQIRPGKLVVLTNVKEENKGECENANTDNLGSLCLQMGVANPQDEPSHPREPEQIYEVSDKLQCNELEPAFQGNTLGECDQITQGGNGRHQNQNSQYSFYNNHQGKMKNINVHMNN